ncbi:MAG: hypothetical protein Q8Q14_05310 [Gemmatimonadales bacterium]|nr:hypothetical protein [Gemmatimonadales bacterium]
MHYNRSAQEVSMVKVDIEAVVAELPEVAPGLLLRDVRAERAAVKRLEAQLAEVRREADEAERRAWASIHNLWTEDAVAEAVARAASHERRRA